MNFWMQLAMWRWEKAKSAISKVGGWSFEVIKPILIELAKDAIKASLGLP